MGEIRRKMDKENLEFHIELYCIIQQYSICGKNVKFEHVVKVLVSDVNFIRSHRQFQSFMLEIETEHKNVLYYTEVVGQR
jgi:hypothetical protein